MSRRTTITVDDELLAEAQQTLGTSGIQDTVDKALAEAVRRARLLHFAAEVRAGTAFDFSPDSVLDRDDHWNAGR
ncbi:MAG: type II toxin-antitoxin system VapB family antitoxin [Pseudonocardia sp.]|nr:type II toxin-antitoxin system VapB family antitoxin [Pseudonocardia sp.]